MTIADKIADALKVASEAFEVGTAIVNAVRRRQWRKVDRILSGDLRTSVARAAGYARAAEHYGDDGDGEG